MESQVEHDALPEVLLTWGQSLNAREWQEVSFAQVYAKDFAHGTAGHVRLMLIAKLADLLDEAEKVKREQYAVKVSGPPWPL